jgi:hypothetical protein
LIKILVWAYYYHITVTKYGDREAITAFPWTFDAAFVLHALISTTVQVSFAKYLAAFLIIPRQVYFSYRIWRVSKRLALAILPWMAAFARTAVALTIAAKLAILDLDKFTQQYKFLIDLSVSLSAFVNRHIVLS